MSKRTIPAKTRAMVAAQLAATETSEIHPAEQAGMAVHQAIEDGVSVVTGAVATGIGYAFGFVKGLIKGH